MTTAEKLVAIENSGFPIAFDGCHKIYFITDEEHRRDCVSFDYEPFFQSTEVRDLISRSCSLVFVSKWGLNNDDFAHPWNIPQCTEDIFEIAKMPGESYAPVVLGGSPDVDSGQ